MGKFAKKFIEMTRKDFQEAGGKAANLGELTRSGFNVPAGFCVIHSFIMWKRTTFSRKSTP
jgi:phosphoenolpyruvate synthase/pyruvate phosphate dikinase